MAGNHRTFNRSRHYPSQTPRTIIRRTRRRQQRKHKQSKLDPRLHSQVLSRSPPSLLKQNVLYQIASSPYLTSIFEPESSHTSASNNFGSSLQMRDSGRTMRHIELLSMPCIRPRTFLGGRLQKITFLLKLTSNSGQQRLGESRARDSTPLAI